LVDIVLAPIGFLSDHMEVVYDLDTEAAGLCRELGVNLFRASTVGVHPALVSMIREMIAERLDGCLATDACPPDCCAPPAGPPVRPVAAP
jgi:ferrochelatase